MRKKRGGREEGGGTKGRSDQGGGRERRLINSARKKKEENGGLGRKKVQISLLVPFFPSPTLHIFFQESNAPPHCSSFFFSRKFPFHFSAKKKLGGRVGAFLAKGSSRGVRRRRTLWVCSGEALPLLLFLAISWNLAGCPFLSSLEREKG